MLFFLLLCGMAFLTANAQDTTTMQDWSQITPSTEISWTPCFDTFRCTRLQVPLDYDEPSAGYTAIAFIMSPGPNGTTKDILINYGGPGASGVGTLLTNSTIEGLFQTEYNVVSFDPRGVNNSGPSLDCFAPDQAATAKNYALMLGRSISGAIPLSCRFAKAKAIGIWCSQALGGPNGTAKYANTPAVASDMLAFIEAQNRARGLAPNDAMLNYVGYSYGTALGSTFAIKFPKRINRMILDGVLDPQVYYDSLYDNNNIHVDEVIEFFFQTCFDAGPDKCPFYESSRLAIAKRYARLAQTLQAAPIPVTDRDVLLMPELAQWSDLLHGLLSSVYNPLTAFPILAQILVDLENGDGKSLLEIDGIIFGYNSSMNYAGSRASQFSGLLIGCIDDYGRNRIDTVDKLGNYVALLNNQSTYLGNAYGGNRILCQSMEIQPPPSGRIEPSAFAKAYNTSFPILIIGNTVDPVTPRESAVKLARTTFPGAVLLTVEAVGHTSNAADSDCTTQVIRNYMAGHLPASTTTCSAEEVPSYSLSPSDLMPYRRARSWAISFAGSRDEDPATQSMGWLV